jgi:hypothetical protein
VRPRLKPGPENNFSGPSGDPPGDIAGRSAGARRSLPAVHKIAEIRGGIAVEGPSRARKIWFEIEFRLRCGGDQDATWGTQVIRR